MTLIIVETQQPFMMKSMKSACLSLGRHHGNFESALASDKHVNLKSPSSATNRSSSFDQSLPTHMEILYQDSFYVAIRKPAGVLVHPTPLDKYEKNILSEQLEANLNQKVFVLHRLDKPVSGVILFALSRDAASKGAQLFTTQQIEKKYLTLVRGFIKKKGEVRHALEDLEDYQTPKSPARREALTRFELLATKEIPVEISRFPVSRFSLVEVLPKTGRTHQIRRHFKQIHHPIIGDTRYGDHKYNHYFKETYGLNYLLLNAVELKFQHPFSETPVKIKAPLDAEFSNILKRLGLLQAVG